MRIHAWRVPPYDNGAYLIVDERRDAICVDPSMGERDVMRVVTKEGLKLLAILNTHGHPDHIYGAGPLQESTRARVAVHRADAYRFDPKRRPQTTFNIPPCTPDDLLDEGPVAYLRDADVRALHTPGHTEGSTCFYLPAERALFSGDVLFAGSVGRVDLPGGDADEMEKSLKRVAGLPPDTRVYPGHGAQTTIGAELPWLTRFRFER